MATFKKLSVRSRVQLKNLILSLRASEMLGFCHSLPFGTAVVPKAAFVLCGLDTQTSSAVETRCEAQEASEREREKPNLFIMVPKPPARVSSAAAAAENAFRAIMPV